MPALRRRRTAPKGRISGSALSAGARHVHRLLERRAHVRRAERDHVPHPARPTRASSGARVVAGAARHQPAHRVPHQRDPLHLHRPRLHERLEQLGERAPVLGDVAAAVVAHVDRRAAQVARPAAKRRCRPASRRRGATRTPSPSGRAGRPRGGAWPPGNARASARRLGRDHLTRTRARPSAPGGRSPPLEHVTHQAVDRGQHRAAARRGGQLAPLGPRAPGQRLAGAAAEQGAAAPQAGVDAGGDRVVRQPGGRARRSGAAEGPLGDARGGSRRSRP